MTRDEELAEMLEHAPGPCQCCSHGDIVTHAGDAEGQVPWEVYEIAHENSGQPLALTFGDGVVRNAVLYAEAPNLLRELLEARRLLREAERYGSFGPYSRIRDRIRAFLDGETKT